jgi:nitrogenase molybdenum-iron protein alpha/beta subunit
MSKPNDFTPPMVMPFADGVYVAANAIPDSILIVDSPSCATYKAERVHGNHDWHSTLSTPSRPRLFQSNLKITDLSMGIDTGLREVFARALKSGNPSLILLTAISLVSITGKQYAHILDEFIPQTSAPIIEIPSRDLYADWLEGYTDTLARLAQHLPLDDPKSSPEVRDVAVIGYFFDRHEGDHKANLDEIRRILNTLGLNPVSTWLDGGPVESLKKVAQAGTILSLPYGRSAAKRLGRRLNKPIIDLPLPVGFRDTAAFIRLLGEAFGVSKQAEKLIKEGERSVLPKLRYAVPRFFDGIQYALFAEPHLADGVIDTLSMVGAQPSALFCPNRPQHFRRSTFNFPEGLDPIIEPTQGQVHRRLTELKQQGRLNLCIGDTLFISFAKPLGSALLEFGFPSYFTHHLVAMPFMGYSGILGMMERVANTVAQHGFQQHNR